MRSLAVAAVGTALLAACGSGDPEPSGPGPKLRTVTLAGGPKARGIAHGQALKAEIARLLERVRPADASTARFAVETCGQRIWPRVPKALQEEIDGVAEGAGRTRHEILYLTTRFELREFGMGGRGGRSEVIGARVEPHADNTVAKVWLDLPASDLVLFLHVDESGKERAKVLAQPGMVGAFLVLNEQVAVAARPRPDTSAVALTGVPWPLVVRMVADGSEFPRLNVGCSYPVARAGKAGTWRGTTTGVEYAEGQEPEPRAGSGLLVRVDEFSVATVRTWR